MARLCKTFAENAVYVPVSQCTTWTAVIIDKMRENPNSRNELAS